ncbi:hypothetical protein BYT27DRAFT_7247044 [Phlegmacium glaucopus]|nr:hypothetical protein BYT27DRAFT_7247044 [Phlegmacium glaucopus]
MKLIIGDYFFIALCLECFLYARITYEFQGVLTNVHIAIVQGTAFGCCDFVAQSILIYRCWIVWGCNIRIVILPSILAFLFLVNWIASNSSEYFFSNQNLQPYWGHCMLVAAVVISMTVNALVTCLIVFKIFKVYHEIKSASGQSLGATGGSKIRTVMFIVTESGMGITPTIILVRVSMGLSFHDQESMIESSIGSLHFVANNPNSISETEDAGIVNRDDDIVNRDDDIVNRDDDIGVQQSDDIEMVDR